MSKAEKNRPMARLVWCSRLTAPRYSVPEMAPPRRTHSALTGSSSASGSAMPRAAAKPATPRATETAETVNQAAFSAALS
nr:hypothetical protein [Mangrovicoccus ximenensis]